MSKPKLDLKLGKKQPAEAHMLGENTTMTVNDIEKANDLVNKIIDYTEDQRRILLDIHTSLEEYTNFLQSEIKRMRDLSGEVDFYER